MAENEEKYWWHRGHRNIIDAICAEFLTQNNLQITDVGCGTGGNYQVLKKYGRVTGIDVAESALEYCRKRNVYDELRQTDSTDLEPASCDVITAFHVLEHIEDDRATLRAWHRALTPNGRIIITVPAYQWLFSAHDRSLHHKRRYYRSDLLKKIIETGFTIERSSFLFYITFPLLCVQRLMSKFKKENDRDTYAKVPRFIEWVLLRTNDLEHFLITHAMNSPFGSSIIVCARKSHD